MLTNKTAVIIAAAGSSRRMGGGLPKQYRLCENLPVLVRTVRVFRACGNFAQLIVSVPQGDLAYCEALFARYGETGLVLVEGGQERMDSVWLALQALSPEVDTVLVHDGARPFVTGAVINRVMTALEEGKQAVIPCVAPKNTIRTMTETLDRSALYEVQTPQGFSRTALVKAYETARAEGFSGTDEAGLTEHCGIDTVIVEGDYRNIKITTVEDLPLMTRTGMGYDVHRLVQGRPLMLGCVQIPFEKGLLGHSDADVICHATADAILGAASMGDIGKHFPDNASDTEGMSGSTLLAETAALVRAAGFTITHIDATLVAEKPKVSVYIESMRSAMAQALSIDMDAVSVKATTEEGLGITGSGEAMAAYAVADLTTRP